MGKKTRIIAFYLPQFHPIPENDEWWGKGFTEWTNVGNAKPLFKGHYQPRVPADLGYYDLRLPIVREQQVELAKKAGIEGFCYWHYWFGNGKELLEKPFKEVLESGTPDFPFCLGWANTDWIAQGWNPEDKRKRQVMMPQLYPGDADILLHYKSYEKAFRDKRYIRVNGKPLFLVYRPFNYHEVSDFITKWNELIKNSGIADGFYFIACTDTPQEHSKVIEMGFDAVTCNPIKRMRIEYDKRSWLSYMFFRIAQKFTKKPFIVIEYKEAIKHMFTEEERQEDTMPILMPNWDRSPRAGRYAVIWHNSTPTLFKKHALYVLKEVNKKKNKIVFLKSWNEWAEGNYMEPDIKFRHGYIDALREALIETGNFPESYEKQK